jgi:hypothetical protein
MEDSVNHLPCFMAAPHWRMIFDGKFSHNRLPKNSPAQTERDEFDRKNP